MKSDTAGNIYCTGYTGIGGSFPGNTNKGGIDIYLTKFNTDGVHQWTVQKGSTEND